MSYNFYKSTDQIVCKRIDRLQKRRYFWARREQQRQQKTRNPKWEPVNWKNRQYNEMYTL